MRSRSIRGVFAALLLALPLSGALAQSFPTQRVTIIIPFGPGGPIDVLGRLIASALEQSWKQPVIVDNRPGASGLIGSQAVAASAPDGYTLGFTGDITTLKLLLKDATSFDGLNSLRPIIEAVYAPFVIVSHSSVPAKTLQEFIAYAKARPNQLNIATIANTQYDMDLRVFMQRAGIDLAMVPYTGGAAGTQAVLRNDVQVYFAVAGLVAGQVAEGKLNALAVTSPVRYSAMANVPTVREAGFDYSAGFGSGFYAPAKTPNAVVSKIAADVAAATKTEAVATRIKQFGFEAPLTGPAAWTAEIQARSRAYAELAQRLGIKPQ